MPAGDGGGNRDDDPSLARQFSARVLAVTPQFFLLRDLNARDAAFNVHGKRGVP
jgi:hypothetical protein